MKKKRYEDGGEVEFESKMGPNPQIDDMTRARAQDYVEEMQRPAPTEIETKEAPKPKKAAPKPQPKAEPKPALKLLLSPDATKSMYSVLLENNPQDIVLMIGPEGGHSPEEEAQAQAAGYQLVCLGERVLRTETAGVVAITAVHSVWNPEMQNRLK